MRTIKYIVLHCTGGPQTQTVDSIQRHWKEKLGWKNPGYHFIIPPDGKLVMLQPIDKPSNGVAGHNANSIHISYIGGVGSKGEILDNRTDQQRTTMEELVRKMKSGFPDATILGHRDFSPDKNRDGVITPDEWVKACPSFSVKEWLQDIELVRDPVMPMVKKIVSTKTGVGVNVRTGPGTTFPIAGKVSDGTVVIISGEQEGWTQVEINDSCSGWIMSTFLK
jgi:N-acetylmuramoyl-L-alanine amidase